MQQIVIDIPQELRATPEIIEEARELEREVYFSKLVSKSFLTEAETQEYENFIQQFVTEDDEPVDNIFSEKQQKLLTHLLYTSWQPLTSTGEPRLFFVTANVGLFARLNPKIKPVVPDVLVSLDVGMPENLHEKQHRSYMIWEFGKPPEIVIEIVSNEIGDELGDKIKKYARIGVKYYVVFDPDEWLTEIPLQVYELTANGYRLREDFDLPETGLSLTLWQGKFENWEKTWLRWLDADGNLLLTADEKNLQIQERATQAEELAKAEAERAAQAEERTEKLAIKLRELGIDPNTIE